MAETGKSLSTVKRIMESLQKPWNRELESELTRKEKRDIKGLAWAEQPKTINEVGSTFTIQGFDLNYAGVILGPSVKYRDGKIIFDPSASHNEKAVRNRTLSDGTKKKFGETLIQHEVRVLMTRAFQLIPYQSAEDTGPICCGLVSMSHSPEKP